MNNFEKTSLQVDTKSPGRLFRKIIRRHGIVVTTLGLTLISIVLSVGITISVNIFDGGNSLGEGLAIAIIAPTIIAPLLSVQMIRLLNHLDKMEQRLREITNIDELTGAHTRRYFINQAALEMKRGQRFGESFSIAILDFDNFKEINDEYGHLVGDQVLRGLCNLIRSNIREVDVMARFGGDEFVFLIPHTGREQIGTWAERIFKIFAATPIRVERSDFNPTFSMGIAVLDSDVHKLDELLKRADVALYQAKKSGGNKFTLA